MMRNQTSRQHNFATVPRSDIPRAKFRMRQTRKMAFDASDLIPIMCEEVLPGDVWTHTENIGARLATPIAPVVDDLDLETFYFFVANRTTWTGTTHINKWEAFITGADDTLTLPKIAPYDLPNTTWELLPGSVFDHFGLLPQTYSADIMKVNVLPIWAYFTIYNEWFRDQNMQNPWTWNLAWTYSSSDTITCEQGTTVKWDQMPLRVNKRSDYFSRSLPWPQKGDPVEIPLGGSAPVFTAPAPLVTGAQNPMSGFSSTAGGAWPAGTRAVFGSDGIIRQGAAETPTGAAGYYPNNLYADLADATMTTINQLRLGFQAQALLEKDARGGSRYVEQLLVHFGVRSPDYRLQRPEYLGGSKVPVTINPIAQTAAYDAEPADAASAVGNLGAEMHVSSHKRTFTYAATEHGYIIGLCALRSTPTYQQGTRRHWLRDARLDFYLPVLANLGEQDVKTREIYQNTDGVYANTTWGYQERWAEYRYTPNEITGVLRSTAAQPLDWWHYAEEFANEPALGLQFITDKTKETLARSLATAPSAQWSAQCIMDIQHDSVVARLMPTYSVPVSLGRF